MSHVERSLWPAVVAGLIGLSIGYAAVTLHEPSVFAQSYRCPLHQQATCEDCDASDCANGTCGAECDGTCLGTHSV